jgi:hypothetical protein
LSGLRISQGYVFENGGGIKSVNGATVNVTNCVFVQNHALGGGNGSGGGIFTIGGKLNVRGSIFNANMAHVGSAIYSFGGTVTIDSSSVTNNGSTFFEPGKTACRMGTVVIEGGTASITGSRVSGNRALTAGGGILSVNSTLTVRDSTIEANLADAGGGIAVSGGSVNVIGCLFARNGTHGAVHPSITAIRGGGLANGFSSSTNPGGIVSITNSTFTANVAVNGGAIYNSLGGTVDLTNSTVSGNTGSSGSGSGGGIDNQPDGTTRLANTIIALNAAPSAPDITGDFVSFGHNLIGRSDGSTGFTHGTHGDKVGSVASPIDPRLASLAANGGPTQTIALLANSPAINMGDDALAPATDQRGYSRSGTSDMGAFELNGLPPVPVQSVVSAKLHGGVPYEIVLPADGVAVECRSGAATNAHTIIFRFLNTLTSVGGVALNGAGSVSSSGIGSDAREYVVDLIGVANAQVITVTLTNVTDSAGNNSPMIGRRMGILLGDVSGNGAVAASDVGQVKAEAGQPVNAANFRSDVIANNAVNATDIGAVKLAAGTQLPAGREVAVSADSREPELPSGRW